MKEDATRRAMRRASPLLATLVAYIPGLALPFVAAFGLPPIQASSILLAYSVALTINGTVGNALEINAISQFSPLFSRTCRPDRRQVASLVFRSTGLTAAVAAILVPITLLLIVGRSSAPSEVTLALIGLLPLPVVYAFSSTLSGAAISSGNTSVSILSQALRALPPLIIMVLGYGGPVYGLALAFVAGELLRSLVLASTMKRFYSKTVFTYSSERLESRGVLWQSGATSVAQVGPMINRSFIIGGGPTAVIAYEIADRIFSAGNQTITSGILLPRLPRWAAPEFMEPSRRTLLQTEVAIIVGIASATAVLGIGTMSAALLAGVVPSSWIDGVRWGMLLLGSLPFTIFIAACGRILILLQKQKLLLPLVLAGLISNLLLNFTLYQLLGTTGIIVALSLSRILLAAVYFVVVRKVFRSIDSWKDLETHETNINPIYSHQR